MNIYTFGFYPNGQLAILTVITETYQEATKLVRDMIPDRYFDDGLTLMDEQPYKG